METDTEIFFYGIKDKYSYMSNFYKVNFTDENNIKYCCSEQYFMYKKCETFDPTNDNLLKLILAEKSATKIKKLGRQVSNYDETIWKNSRYDIMVEGLKLKFSQNEDIKQKLLLTSNKSLFEASKYDKIWGIGYYANDAINTDKSKFGTNLLGKALMEVRTHLST